jgi:hypothetical protein
MEALLYERVSSRNLGRLCRARRNRSLRPLALFVTTSVSATPVSINVSAVFDVSSRRGSDIATANFLEHRKGEVHDGVKARIGPARSGQVLHKRDAHISVYYAL